MGFSVDLFGGFLYAWHMVFFARLRPILSACDAETAIGFDNRPTRMGSDITCFYTMGTFLLFARRLLLCVR